MARRSKLVSASTSIKNKATNGLPKVGGKVVLEDTTMYINFSIKGHSGTISIVDVNTKREVGVTNFDGNKFNAGTDFVIDSIRALRGALNVANVRAEKYVVTGDLDPALQNAEIRLKQGNVSLFRLPFSELFSKGNELEAFRSISTLPLIMSNKEFEFEIEYPKGISVPADAEMNIRIEMRGHKGKI
jgi:hypothetical protein